MANSNKVPGGAESPPGLPAAETVVARLVLSPGKPRREVPSGARVSAAPQRTYEILRTNQVDPYERQPETNQDVLAAPQAMRAAGDKFGGTSRRKAKISIARARVETFDDIKSLIASLPDEDGMINREPEISKGKDSGRVDEERRNVRVRAWIYAASRETDNDFHLIVGRHSSKPQMYLTMEVSGLPPTTASSYAKIKKVRDVYKLFFTDLPGSGYDFYKPPIPVEIGGSLFFDITHATGGRPGPKDLRSHIPVIWEVHPVTYLVFEP
jgi:hypothetical protein